MAEAVGVTRFDVVSIKNPNKLESRWNTLQEAEDHVIGFGMFLDYEINEVTVKKRRFVYPEFVQKHDA